MNHNVFHNNTRETSPEPATNPGEFSTNVEPTDPQTLPIAETDASWGLMMRILQLATHYRREALEIQSLYEALPQVDRRAVLDRTVDYLVGESETLTATALFTSAGQSVAPQEGLVLPVGFTPIEVEFGGKTYRVMPVKDDDEDARVQSWGLHEMETVENEEPAPPAEEPDPLAVPIAETARSRSFLLGLVRMAAAHHKEAARLLGVYRETFPEEERREILEAITETAYYDSMHLLGSAILTATGQNIPPSEMNDRLNLRPVLFDVDGDLFAVTPRESDGRDQSHPPRWQVVAIKHDDFDASPFYQGDSIDRSILKEHLEPDPDATG